jgi:PHP family Zn ribbon phosphoesterase
MNIHEEVAWQLKQQLIESAEAIGRGEVTDIDQHVKNQINIITNMRAAIELSAKLEGVCMRCNAKIPIGGRPICNNTKTSALCEKCGKWVRQIILDRITARLS